MDEFTKALQEFRRSGDPVPLRRVLDLPERCEACGETALPMRDGICAACHEGQAGFDVPRGVTFDRAEVPGSTCNAGCGWCGRCT